MVLEGGGGLIRPLEEMGAHGIEAVVVLESEPTGGSRHATRAILQTQAIVLRPRARGGAELTGARVSAQMIENIEMMAAEEET